MTLSQIPLSNFSMALSYGVEQLPSFVFKKELSDISTALTNLQQTMDIKLSSTSTDLDSDHIEQVVRQVIDQYTLLRQSPEYAEYFKPLNTLASNLGTEITGVLNTLNTVVRPEVELLKDSIVSATAEELSASHVTKEEHAPASMNVLDWDQYTNHFGGITNVLESLNTFFKIPLGLGTSSFSVFTERSPAKQWQTSLTLPETGETYDDMYRRLVSVFPDEKRDYAENVLKGIVNISHFEDLFVWPVIKLTKDNNQWMDNISNQLYINQYIDIVEKMKKTPLDVTNEIMDVVHHRLYLIEICLQFAVFAFNTYRKYYSQQEALVLNTAYLNKDVVSSISEDTSFVEKYVYTTHVTKSIPVPNNGITLAAIEPYKESAIEKFEALQIANTNNQHLLEQNATVSAMYHVMERYLESTDVSRLPENTHIDEFVKSKLWLIDRYRNRLNIGADNNLESILYDFVINCHFENTAVATAHELYGTNVISLINSGADINREDLAVVDASVAASIAARFIFNELCEPVK